MESRDSPKLTRHRADLSTERWIKDDDKRNGCRGSRVNRAGEKTRIEICDIRKLAFWFDPAV